MKTRRKSKYDKEFNGLRLCHFGACMILLSVPFYFGCGTTHTVKVDAISSPATGNAFESYTIVASPSSESSSSDSYLQITQQVKTALSGKGWYEAGSINQADLLIELSYGVSRPQIDFKIISPMELSMTGKVSKSSSHRLVSRDGFPVVPVTKYEKFITLTAWQNNGEYLYDENPQIWNVRVKIHDESNDLEENTAILLAAAIPYMGEDSGHIQEVKVSANNPSVKFISTGL